jgi:hypothetical protein
VPRAAGGASWKRIVVANPEMREADIGYLTKLLSQLAFSIVGESIICWSVIPEGHQCFGAGAPNTIELLFVAHNLAK